MNKFVFPNIATIEQRSNLHERDEKMRELNSLLRTEEFQAVEVPGDFVKNKTEKKKTGLRLGSMLLESKHVKAIYSPTLEEPQQRKVMYILHTEPQFSRRGRTKSFTPKLKWFDHSWVDSFIMHITNIISYLGTSPYGIEVHPGTQQWGKNNFEHLLAAIKTIRQRLSQLKCNPLIFIENRTGQIIKTGEDISEFWCCLKEHEMTESCGFMLDVQQLYTATKEDVSVILKCSKDVQ